MKVKPLLRWPGGKSRLLKHLLPRVPEHRLYVEVFGGGLALLLALPKKRGEVVNDTHRDLVNLYRVAQRHPDELARVWEWECAALVNFKDYMAQPGLTDIERAVRFWNRCMTCFGCNDTSWAVQRDPNSGAASGLSRMLPRLKEWRARMDGVAIECLDLPRLLDLYDHAETFFFLDPPYVCPDIGRYDSFTQADMEALAARLRTLKGKWMLTVNNSPANRALWKGCRIHAVQSQSGAARADSRKKHGELIITA